MTYRQFFAIIVIVGTLTVGRQLAGDQIVVVYFTLVGVLGLWGTYRYFRIRNALADHLSGMDETDRNRILTILENEEIRADVASDLEGAAPAVPLRSSAEIYRYPDSVWRTSLWTMRGCFIFAAFIAVGTLTDVALGRTVFWDPQTTAWWEIGGIVLGFSIMGIVMAWSAREGRGVLEVSDEALTWRVTGRRPKTIKWDEVSEVRRGDLSRRLLVRSASAKISVADTITGYGRVVNLVTTRALQNHGD